MKKQNNRRSATGKIKTTTKRVRKPVASRMKPSSGITLGPFKATYSEEPLTYRYVVLFALLVGLIAIAFFIGPVIACLPQTALKQSPLLLNTFRWK